jgi:hypothetical protein
MTTILWLRVVPETGGAMVANVLVRADCASDGRALSAMGLQRIIFLMLQVDLGIDQLSLS